MKCKFEDFKLFFVSPDPKIGECGSYFGPVLPNCPNGPNTLKQVKPKPQIAFKFE